MSLAGYEITKNECSTLHLLFTISASLIEFILFMSSLVSCTVLDWFWWFLFLFWFVFFLNSANGLVTISALLQDNTVAASIRIRHNTEICHTLVLLVRVVLERAVISYVKFRSTLTLPPSGMSVPNCV